MKKKFINVALFCALAMSAPLFTGCADYDDDISNLQTQIDGLKGSAVTLEEAKAAVNEAIASLKQELETAISGKADNSAVIALQEKAQELTDALNNKADNQTIADLAGQVQDLIAQVNNVEGTLNQTTADLTNQLENLKKAYEEADKVLADALNLKADAETVTNLQGQLEETKLELTNTLITLSNKVNTLESLVGTNTSDVATLKEEIGNLKNNIETLTTQYGTIASQLADKADKSTVDELNGKLEGIQADLLNYVNKGEVEVIKGQLGDLMGQLNNLTTDLGNRPTREEVTQEITEKINDLGELVNVNVFEAYKSEIEIKLQDITEDISDHETRLQEVETLAANNGQSIVDLTTRIEGLEAILEGFENQPGGDISETVLGQIVALTGRIDAIDGENGALFALNKKYETLNSQIATLQQKLTETQLNALNDIANWDSTKNGSIVSVLEKVVELEKALNAGTEEGAPAVDLSEIAGQLSSLQSELDQLGLMTKMIQSIIFVPQTGDLNNGVVTLNKNVEFKTLSLPYTTSTGIAFKPAATNKSQKIQFRISPVSAAEDFAENYDIEFRGKAITVRNAMPNVLSIMPDTKPVHIGNGIIEMEVVTSEENNGNSLRAWALTAKVTPKDKEDIEQYTEINSDYFVVVNQNMQVRNIDVVTSNTNNSPNWEYDAWEDGTTSIDYSVNEKLLDRATGTDLRAEFPTAQFNVVYKPTYSTLAENYFTVEGAKVTLKEGTGNLAIGESVSMSATVSIPGFNITHSTSQGTVSIVRATPVYELGTLNAKNWHATDNVVLELSANDILEIMERSGLTQNQFWTAIGTLEPGSNISGNVYFDVNTTDRKIYIKQNTNASITTDQNIQLIFKTDETGNTFTIKATVKAMAQNQYPQITFTKDEQAWDSNKANVGLLPVKNASTGKVTLERNLETIFKDYSGTGGKLDQITSNGGTVTFSATMDGAYYGLSGNKIIVNPATYTGKPIKIKVTVAYGSQVIDVATVNAGVVVQDLSGTWVVNKDNATGYNPLVRTMVSGGIDLSKGFEWKDYAGITMWKDGSAMTTSKPADFALNNPTFSIVGGNSQFVEIRGNRLVFTGAENNFLEDTEIKVKVNVSNRWGDIDNYNDNTSIISVIIPAGTYTN